MRIQFPFLGLDESRAAQDTPLQTSFSLQNVRVFDASDEKFRGGQRAGTVLAYTTQISGEHPIINMSSIVTTYITAEP